MKLTHTPRIDARYWIAITLASVFGTNMGDLYAHDSGLGIWSGLAVLAALAAVVFVIERFDGLRHEAYYWLVIVIIRTGATNIADYLAYRVRVPDLPLTLGLAALIAVFGLGTRSAGRSADRAAGLPKTNAAYWLAMLSAGVFGTVLGDICEHIYGEGTAAVGLTVILIVALLAGFRYAARFLAVYWGIVAVARTAGTAIGDWLAENQVVQIGLAHSTLLSALAFVAVLIFWKGRDRQFPSPVSSGPAAV
jgi:uncharacterized membrane-anchored protein